MKKMILLCSTFMVVAAIAVTISLKTQSKDSDLLTANIEALANEEEEDWYYDKTVGEVTVSSGETIPCCVDGTTGCTGGLDCVTY